jgi:hypothetical protein
MSLVALSTTGFSQYLSASSGVSASQQDFQSLQQSLASGNLAAAQSAFNAYQQLNLPPTSTTGGSSTPTLFATNLASLGSAISSGNVAKAQSAFATLQTGLNASPSQSITNAETAVAQTVQWIDDLLSLSSQGSTSSAPYDPTTSILDSAYGLPSSTTATTDPTTSLLDSAYGATPSTATGTSTTGTSTTGTSAATTAAPPASATPAATSGNTGSAASVNSYA